MCRDLVLVMPKDWDTLAIGFSILQKNYWYGNRLLRSR